MKKYLKKISAFLLAAITMLAMCSVTALAGDTAPTYPTPADTAKIAVQNVEEGATVTAYQIVKADYVTGIGFEKYSNVDGITLADTVKPTSAEITAIAAKIAKGELTLPSQTLTFDANGEYSADVAAGYWVVLVTGTVDKVYNPMLAGVYYTDGSKNTLVNGTVDANSKWSIEGSTAYDKSVDVSVGKKITNSTGKTTTGAASEKGDDFAIGDFVSYEVKGTIPSYTDAYTQVTYKITDTTSEGLVLKNDDEHPVVVTVDGDEYEELDADGDRVYTLTVQDHNLVVEFSSDYALKMKGKEVVVTYSAQLTDAAATNLDANTNSVKVTYTNDPTITDGKTPTTDTPESKTYVYTFEIDGNLSANDKVINNKVTTELTKRGAETSTDTTTDQKNKPLPGAKFTLKNTVTNKEYYAVSDNNGALNFKGLDAGTYELWETEAPAGYSINSKKISVVISADYNENGTLHSYTITVDGKATSTYTAVYDGKTNELTEVTVNSTDTDIPNTKMSNLPSTGGIGTYIFTVIGIAVMAIAAGMFLVSRRKRS